MVMPEDTEDNPTRAAREPAIEESAVRPSAPYAMDVPRVIKAVRMTRRRLA